MSRDIETGRGVVIPAAEIALHFSRSGGPGGQNVNKRDTQVEVRFDVQGSAALNQEQKARIRARLRSRIDADGTLRVVANEERTQGLNRERALQRLEALLHTALAPPPKPRRKTRPTKSAVERRITDKKRRGEVKRLRRAADD